MGHTKKSNTPPKTKLPPQPSITMIWTRLMNVVFFISFIALAYLFYMHMNVQYIGAIMLLDIVLSILYWVRHKRYVLTHEAVEKEMRIIIAYIISMITVTFYVISLVRSNQMSDTIERIIIVASLFIGYAIYHGTKGLLPKLIENKENR
ncbi:hypothetical protein [Veillonella montpellierensis]|uniref:hypothetical protein n=1 Tax=Veillonella montpellierensis TaxID=187328 RepID=UPI000487628C|nr:hypothetical protein [Veillonella montpellierensis]